VVVVNNGQRDISLIEYDVERIDGIFAEYDLGILDFATGQPIQLPLAVAAGHAVRFRVRSLLNLSPEAAATLIQDGRSLPTRFPRIAELFHRLYSHGIDCFGNRVSGGPGGYNLLEGDSIANERVRFSLLTGRGNVFVDTLRWYDSSNENRPWPRGKEPKP
jgi:hypothetical protein